MTFEVENTDLKPIAGIFLTTKRNTSEKSGIFSNNHQYCRRPSTLTLA